MPNAYMTDLLESVVGRGRSLMGLPRAGVRGSLGDLVALTEALLSRRGEASGVAIAADLLQMLHRAPTADRVGYLTVLADRFGADRERLAAAIKAWQDNPNAKAELELQIAAEPRRQEVIRRLNMAPGGTAALVALRAELLQALPARPDLAPLDADFLHLFAGWFSRGFLVLRQIDWTTPANILEKIIAYEAVHEISDWDDLRRRVEPSDRFCFAFFHPQLADEPLVFVQVALTKEIPEAIGPLLERDRKPIAADEATTAVFYSISAAQRGLVGVSFGHFLIKQVVEELKREVPSLSTFVTLSPSPGFAAWLAKERASSNSKVLTPADRTALKALDQPGWHTDAAKTETLKDVLPALAAHYYLRAKNSAGRPPDSVARFHLGNGARLERINWLGDVSKKGLAQGHGIMVNYLYDLPTIEENHEAYAEKCVVVASPRARRLLRPDAKGASGATAKLTPSTLTSPTIDRRHGRRTCQPDFRSLSWPISAAPMRALRCSTEKRSGRSSATRWPTIQICRQRLPPSCATSRRRAR